MSQNNGVIRIGRKGRRKFAIGEEDDKRALPVFEIDVVEAFQRWLEIDDGFRPTVADDDGRRTIPIAEMKQYHAAAQTFVAELMSDSMGREVKGEEITVAEALDFLARLREQYNELADFFVPKSREEQDSPGTSEEASLQFSEEGKEPA